MLRSLYTMSLGELAFKAFQMFFPRWAFHMRFIWKNYSIEYEEGKVL